MGFKMKHGPISMKGSPALVDEPDPKKLEVVDLVAKGKAEQKVRKEKADALAKSRSELTNTILQPFRTGKAAGWNSYRNRKAESMRLKKEAFSGAADSKPQSFRELGNWRKPANPFESLTVEGIKIGSLNSAQPVDKTSPPKNNQPPKGGDQGEQRPKPKRSYKEAYAKRDMNTYGNLTQAEYTAEAKRQKAGGKVPKSQMKGSLNLTTQKKTTTSNNSGDSNNYTKNINNKTQKRKEAEAKYLKSTDSKAPKVDKVLSKRELRLENVKRKAANEKAKTNKTAQSIDASKPTSADTGAKQTSARSSRSKAKRLENRATRIQGRIDRKGKSSAEKRASRKATRQKVRENR